MRSACCATETGKLKYVLSTRNKWNMCVTVMCSLCLHRDSSLNQLLCLIRIYMNNKAIAGTAIYCRVADAQTWCRWFRNLQNENRNFRTISWWVDRTAQHTDITIVCESVIRTTQLPTRRRMLKLIRNPFHCKEQECCWMRQASAEVKCDEFSFHVWWREQRAHTYLIFIIIITPTYGTCIPAPGIIFHKGHTHTANLLTHNFMMIKHIPYITLSVTSVCCLYCVFPIHHLQSHIQMLCQLRDTSCSYLLGAHAHAHRTRTKIIPTHTEWTNGSCRWHNDDSNEMSWYLKHRSLSTQRMLLSSSMSSAQSQRDKTPSIYICKKHLVAEGNWQNQAFDFTARKSIHPYMSV